MDNLFASLDGSFLSVLMSRKFSLATLSAKLIETPIAALLIFSFSFHDWVKHPLPPPRQSIAYFVYSIIVTASNIEAIEEKKNEYLL